MGIQKVAKTGVFAILCVALGAAIAGRLLSVAPVAAQTSPILIAQAFRVVDQNGVPRASLSVENEVTQLVLNDSKGVMRVLVQVNPDGSPFAMFWDKNGGGSYDVRFRTPSINFMDSQDRITASLPLTGMMTPVEPMPERGGGQATGGRFPSSGDASRESVIALQSDIDLLRDRVSKLTVRVNKLYEQ